jgi:hypothetical protein
MQSATECAPRKCQCGRRLAKPTYGYPWLNQANTARFGFEWCLYEAPIKEKVWHIKCFCGLRHVWSWHHKSNGCWKIRSHMPLFDSQEITVIAGEPRK